MDCAIPLFPRGERGPQGAAVPLGVLGLATAHGIWVEAETGAGRKLMAGGGASRGKAWPSNPPA